MNQTFSKKDRTVPANTAKSNLHKQQSNADNVRLLKNNSRIKPDLFKLIMGAFIMIQVPFLASAQEADFKNSTPEERARFQTEWMQSELSLDSTVITSVYNINLKYSEKTQSIMNSGASKMQKYKDFKATSDAKDSELKSVFTKEQYKLYQQKKEEIKQKMRERIQEKRKNK